MLRVHFLNVGHGDCTIIKHHSGHLTMVDINNSQDYDEATFMEMMEEQKRKSNPLALALGLGTGVALTGSPFAQALSPYYLETLAKAKTELTDPIDFIQKQYPGETLWRFILTHPDMDHMRGIRRLYENIRFANFWDTRHAKPSPNFRSDDDKVDWEFYQQLRTGNVGPGPKFYTRGDSLFAFGRDEYGQPGGDNIEILSPTSDLVRACNESGKSNSLSLVLRVWHAGKNVLLPGDAEDDAWEIMTDFYGNYLKSDFLKASHHGRDTGYNLGAVQIISPSLTFVSVGRKPDTDASSKYRRQCPRVASTRYHGNIELRIHDNGQHQWLVDRNPG